MMRIRLLALVAFALTLSACDNNLPDNQPQSSYAEDRALIEDLQGRYILAMDFNDADAYANTFAEDGILNWARGEVVGRDAIRAFKADGTYDLSSFAQEGKWPAAVRHFITNQVIKVDGNTAKAVTYWFQTINPDPDRVTVQVLRYGHYEDDLVKIDGNWYFKYRTLFNEGHPTRHADPTKNPGW